MRYAKEWSRKKILEKGMVFPQGWMELIYTNHALDRLKERGKGSLVAGPRNINVSTLNIYKGYSYDDKNLHKVIVRLEFSSSEWIFLVILPHERVVKSLWFTKKDDGKRRRMAANAATMERAKGKKVLELRSMDMGGKQTPLLGPPAGEEQKEIQAPQTGER